MRTEQSGANRDDNVDRLAFSAEEEKIEEAILRQKLYIQEEVMKKLGVLPPNYQGDNFDRSNYELPQVYEDRAQNWSTVLVLGDESKAAIFNRLYKKQVAKYTEKVVSESEINQIINAIVTEFESMNLNGT